MRKSATLTPLVLALLCAACVRQPPAPADKENLPAQVQSIAILPPIATPESGSDPASPKVKAEMTAGMAALNGALTDYFAGNPIVRLLTEDEVAANATSMTANRLEQAMAAGKAIHAEAIMLLNLDRYHERQGSDYSIKSPASVAFEYRLLLTESGQTLCAGSFDETQRSITDNLLAFKSQANRGFKWIPASDLLREGINAKMPACQYLKAKPASPAAAGAAPPDATADPHPGPQDLANPPPAKTADKAVAPAAVNPSPAQADTQPTTAPTVAAPDLVEPEVRSFLEDWRLAWEGTAGPHGDMDRYAAMYDAGFQAKNQGRSGWLAEKTEKDRKKAWIRIELTDIKVTPLANGQTVEVNFTQNYASSNYTATDVKTLRLKKSGPRWEIVSER